MYFVTLEGTNREKKGIAIIEGLKSFCWKIRIRGRKRWNQHEKDRLFKYSCGRLVTYGLQYSNVKKLTIINANENFWYLTRSNDKCIIILKNSVEQIHKVVFSNWTSNSRVELELGTRKLFSLTTDSDNATT